MAITRVWIEEGCIACGLSAESCPEVFELKWVECDSVVVKEGVNYSIEATGLVKVAETAFQAVKNKGGLCIIAGHPAHGETVRINPFDLIKGKRIQGSWGGDCKPDRDIPLLGKYFLEGKLPLEKLISHRFSLENINKALNGLEEGNLKRALIEMKH